MSNSKTHQEDIFEQKNQINFKMLLTKVVNNWYWFILSIIVCLSISYIYLRYTAQTYMSTAKILISKDKDSGSENDALNKALGGQFGTANNIQGEAEILKTRHLMEQVVKQLKSYITYYHKGQIRSVDLYKDAPFRLTLFGSPSKIVPKSLEVKINGVKVDVSSADFHKQVNLYEKFIIPGLGNVQIEKGNGVMQPGDIYVVNVNTIKGTVNALLGNLSVTIPIKDVNILSLDYLSQVPESSVDVLNTLIQAYIDGNIIDKNKIADSTIAFIEDRLVYVNQELGHIEGKVQTFKQNNKVTDIAAQSTQLISTTSDYSEQLAKVETQISVLNSIEDYLLDSKNSKNIVPSGALLDDPGFAGLVERYNALVLEKEKGSLRQTDDNPFMQNLNTQIATSRADMISGLGSLKNTLKIAKARILGRTNTIAGEVKNVPAVERTFMDLGRQQQIKQDLYVFLMTKREETAISKTSNISNCKIIEPPATLGAISPVRNNVLGYGLVLGFFIPFGIIFLRDRLNTRITSKEDVLNHTQVSIIGEIGKSADSDSIIVTVQGSRTPISEQFRAVRTNLSFFLKDGQKTVMLTSSMSGEGKSFIALNLALALAISGKKVIVIEMDLRKPTLSRKLNIKNDMGFTNYIISTELTAEAVTKPSGLHENLVIISSGNIPPNPSEIILDKRTDKLMEELYRNYDYVFIDAPPVGMVADAQLLSKYSDLTLYVVRQDYTYKEQLSIPQELFVNKKMKHIAILLNDVKLSSSYGYGYGYGYGLEVEKESLMDKFFKKS